MKVIYEKKIYRIVIVVNELEEFATSFRDKSRSESISIDSILNNRGSYSTHREDVFIGGSAKWSLVQERIEDYYHLSFLHAACLEIHYYSDFGEQTKAYSANSNYLHFYDNCILKETLLDSLALFNSGFKTVFYHKNRIELKQTKLKCMQTDFGNGHNVNGLNFISKGQLRLA